MAKAAGRSAPKRSKKSKARASDPATALREALLRLVAKRGWRDLSYAEIAEEAGIGLAQALGTYSSKGSILAGNVKAIDQSVIAGLDAEPLEGSIRDRLFDLLMRRFDQLKPHRLAYAALAQEIAWTPAEALCLAFAMRRSMAMTLEAAGTSASGLFGGAKIEALGGVYALALRTFFKDESADLSATMAILDKRLSQLDRLCQLARCNRRK